MTGIGGFSSCSSSRVEGNTSTQEFDKPASAARLANQSTDCLLSESELSIGIGFGKSCVELERATFEMLALMCRGGAESPNTRPETGGPLLSTVFVGRNVFPPWMDRINALTASGPEASTGGVSKGAGGGGGGGGGRGRSGPGERGEATVEPAEAPDVGVGNILPKSCCAILALVALDLAISSSLLSSSLSFSLTSSQSSSMLDEGAML